MEHKKRERVSALLEKSSLFNGVSEELLKKLFREDTFRFKEFSKKEFVIRIEDSSPYIAMVISGFMEIQKPLISGEIISMILKTPGDIFGGGIAFSNKKTYPCDIYAHTDGELLLIHKEVLLDIAQENRSFLAKLIALFSETILRYEKRIELFSTSSIKYKIAFYLLDDDLSGSDSSSVHLPFPKTTWARFLNVSRPTLLRELKSLCNAGIISVDKRFITIIDKERLQELLLS